MSRKHPMPSHKDRLYRLKQKLIIVEKYIASASLLLLLILALTQVILRNFFELGFANMDIVARHLVLFITFIGAALACEHSQHIKIDFINALLSSETKNKLKQPLLFISAMISSLFFWYALQFWLDEQRYAPQGEQLALYLALILPVGFFILSLHFFLLSFTTNHVVKN